MLLDPSLKVAALYGVESVGPHRCRWAKADGPSRRGLFTRRRRCEMWARGSRHRRVSRSRRWTCRRSPKKSIEGVLYPDASSWLALVAIGAPSGRPCPPAEASLTAAGISPVLEFSATILGGASAALVFDGLLHHESEPRIEDHYSDTAGFTDHVFGLCQLLGFRFAHLHSACR